MSPPKQQQPVREEAAMMERRKCVVDFLSFLETIASSFANSLGLPAFGILSASWSYGINIENAVIRFRNANPAFAYGLANMTIEEFVHFLLVPDAYPKYAAWSDRLLSMIETSALSPTMTAATMSAALAGASKCLSSYASKAARESAASLSKQLKSPPSSSSQKNSIDRNTKLVDALAGLSAAFGVKPGVDYFSKLSNKFLEKIDAKQQRGKATTTAAPESKDALSAFISSIRKKLSRAVASKNINGQAQIVASVAVVSDDDVAKPFIESLNRFVVVLDSMTLRKGSHPDVKVDASEALLKLSTLLEHVVKKASADKAAKKALVATVSAFADVFRKSKLVAGTSKEQREQLAANDRVLKMLDAYTAPLSSAQATSLKKMGVFGATTQSLFFRGGVAPPPPPPAAPYPYPPGQAAPYGPYPGGPSSPYYGPPGPTGRPAQDVYVHEDPYMKTVAGLSVGAQCCSCCAMWELADAVAEN